MPRLIRLTGPEGEGPPQFAWAEDGFVALAEDEAPGPNTGDLLLSWTRFQAEGSAFLEGGRRLGVRLRPEEAVEAIAPHLHQLSLVALEFPKFRDGRAFSAAALLRSRYGYAGELRAVGDVLRDLAKDMVRCGFDSFEPADGSDPDMWARAALRYRHVYQRAEDGRAPAFAERAEGAA